MFKSVLTLFVLGFAMVAASPKNTPTCDICVLLVKTAEGLVQKNQTETEIINFIENQVCGKLGALASVCNQYVEAYGRIVIEELIQKADPNEICKKIGLCSSRFVLAPEIKLNNKIHADPIFCTVCQYAVQFLDHELATNKTEAAIVTALDKVCKIAPASLRDQCDALVNSYGVYLVQLLIELADPLKVCQAIKLC